MPAETTASFLDALRTYRLLDGEQLDQLARELAGTSPEPLALARQLIERGWLTPFQVNQFFQGKGRDLLLGSYVLLERLGEGGMGQVFKARNWKLGRTVALKLIRKQRLDSPEAVGRFQREIRAAATLDHPHIVRAFDADEVAGTHFFVMEHVAGCDLNRLVQGQGPLPIPTACEYVRQAALGLQHAHERGLVHRDIKPANLLVEGVGSGEWGIGEEKKRRSSSPLPTPHSPLPRLKILDMGLARFTQTVGDETASAVTQDGMLMGTPDFMAPEQAVESHTVDIRADLYSLGCTFYFLLTGRVPFPTGTLIQKLNNHQFKEPTHVQDLRPEVPLEVAAVVRKLMAKRPEDRYRTPAEAAEALEALLGGLTASERPWLGGTAIRNLLDAAPSADTRGEETVAVPRKPKAAPKPKADNPPALAGSATVLQQTLRNLREAPRLPVRRPWLVAGSATCCVVLMGALLVAMQMGRSGPPPAPVADDDPLAHLQGRPRPKLPAPAPPADDPWLRHVASLPAGQQVEAVAQKLRELNPGFDGKLTHQVEGGVVTELELLTDQVADLTPLQALAGLKKLKCAGTNGVGENTGKLDNLSALQGLPLTWLDCRNNPALADLAPLRGLPLTYLHCAYTAVTDLRPLQELPLAYLHIYATPVADLSPLRGSKLTWLDCGLSQVTHLGPLKGVPLSTFDCSHCKVADLSPLTGAPLKFLRCLSTEVRDLSPLPSLTQLKHLGIKGIPADDLSPLANVPLTHLELNVNAWRGDAELLRSIPMLTHVNGKKLAEFWREFDAERATFDAWCKEVAALPAEKQVEAVAAELKKRNPDFDGQVRHQVQDGVVTELSFMTDGVTDLVPVRALPGLKSLTCKGSDVGKGKLAGLWPLQQMGLPLLDCSYTAVADLSPLRGMRLEQLSCGHTRVTDLSPLQGMPLTGLWCVNTGVADLTPLRGTPLAYLDCSATRVSDLSPLRGLPLKRFTCVESAVADLAPLRGAPLQFLTCLRAKVTDLTPLTEMPKLEEVECDFVPWRDAEVLRSVQTLQRINGQPAAAFWKAQAQAAP